MSPVQTLKHATKGRRERFVLGTRYEGHRTSVPWTAWGLVRSANGRNLRIDAPYDSPVRNEDAVYQLRSVMGAIRTRCVNFVTYFSQQHLASTKIHFFPVIRVRLRNGRWMHMRRIRIPTFRHRLCCLHHTLGASSLIPSLRLLLKWRMGCEYERGRKGDKSVVTSSVLCIISDGPTAGNS